MTGTGRTPPFELHLLGSFKLTAANGAALSFKTRKAEWLLAFLACPAGQSHARERLANLFWADRGDEQARSSLRTALADIRTLLEDTLVADRDSVTVRPDALSTDVSQLAEAANGARVFDPRFLGELLAGCNAPSVEFADWLAFERNRCRGLATRALHAAIESNRTQGQFSRAIELADTLINLDPLREKSQRLLMQIYAESGERSLALKQFQLCKELLKRELDAEPSPETAALAESLSGSPVGSKVAGKMLVGSLPSQPEFRFSVAVLPFVNAGGDPEHDAFAAGISDDIITELSRSSDFAVIARQSAFQYPGHHATASAAAMELSARYVLTGSLRRGAGQIRLNVQLIEARHDHCIWAERYDRSAGDVFAVVDEIAASVAGNVDSTVRRHERERVAHLTAENLDAWELFHRGLWHAYRLGRADLDTAEDLFRRSAARAPNFSLPHAGLGYLGYVRCMWFYAADFGQTLKEAIAHANMAVELDPIGALGQVVRGRLLAVAGEYEAAMRALKHAVETNPGFAQAHFGLAQALAYAGRTGEALAEIQIGFNLSPKDPLSSMFLTMKSYCHLDQSDFDQAEKAARQAVQADGRKITAWLAHATSLVALGRLEEAKLAVDEARRREPLFTLERLDNLIRHTPASLRSLILKSLRQAGAD